MSIKIFGKIDSMRFHFWRCNIRLCSLYFTHLAYITLYFSCTCIFTRYFHFYCSTNWTIWWKLRYRKIKHCYFRNNFTLLCFFVLHRLCKRKIAPLLIFTTFYYYWNIFFSFYRNRELKLWNHCSHLRFSILFHVFTLLEKKLH